MLNKVVRRFLTLLTLFQRESVPLVSPELSGPTRSYERNRSAQHLLHQGGLQSKIIRRVEQPSQAQFEAFLTEFN